jgi:hypothetical protein
MVVVMDTVTDDEMAVGHSEAETLSSHVPHRAPARDPRAALEALIGHRIRAAANCPETKGT